MIDSDPLDIALFHVSATFTPRGSERYCWELGRYLHDRGHRVRLLAGATPSPIIQYPEVPLHVFPFRSRERFPNLGSRFRRLGERLSFGLNSRAHLYVQPPHILNIHKPYDLPFALWLRRRTGCKVVLRFHGKDFFPGVGALLRRADAVYCVSRRAQRMLEPLGPIPSQIIHTGVDTAFFRAETPPDPKHILYFGSLEGWKGVDTLIQALIHIRDRGWQARIVGDGAQKAELQRAVERAGLAQRIRLEPAVKHRDEVKRLLDHAGICVFPSRDNETFSNAVLEAMSMGRAVIASDAGGFPEAITHDRDGLLFPPGDAQALAARLQTLIQTPNQAQQLGAQARAAAETRFNAEASFERVTALFRSLVSVP